jgi:predicted enzyme related to lactoylglutathione lyase
MGERTQHPPGAFSWAELTTTDADGAKAFYTGLFGWEIDDNPMPDGGVYTLLRRGGKAAAALFQATEERPVAWLSYITVDSADATAAAVTEHGGGAPMGPPFDVMDLGRMAVVHDPAGAFFAIWEPRGSIGSEVVNEPGALSLNQLNTNDPEGAQRFYEAVFGWRFDFVGTDDNRYWGIYNDDRLNAGMMPLPPGLDAPPHWLVYFGSEGVDDDARRVEELGGRVLVPPTDVPGGRFISAMDPQGGVFAQFSGRFDD